MVKYTNKDFKENYCSDFEDYQNFCNAIINETKKSKRFRKTKFGKSYEAISATQFGESDTFYLADYILAKTKPMRFILKNVYITKNKEEAINFILDTHNQIKLLGKKPKLE